MDNRPTKEQLEADLKKSQELLEKEIADDTPTEEEETITPDETTEEDKPQEETQDEEQPTEETPDETDVTDEKTVEEEEETTTPDKQDVDYKKKFTESTRESMILINKQKRLNEAVDEANSLPEPTDNELIQEARMQGFNYEDLSDFEKLMFKGKIHNDRKFGKISEATQMSRDLDAWNKKVDEFVGDPKTMIAYPQLEGKEEEFKAYTVKTGRRGVDFDVLVPAFIQMMQTTKPKHTGKMFETGTSTVTKTKPAPDKISIAEAEKIRKTNYAKYKELLLSGKIATEL